MKTLQILIVSIILACGSVALAKPALDITLQAVAENPAAPKMGDHMAFRSIITNKGESPLRGMVAWLSLVRVDPGNEQPVDLEDWSAKKAVSRSIVIPGETFSVLWPMRLIQDGSYRVIISAAAPGLVRIVTSPFADFTVLRKKTVESSRILPVAIGVPLAFLLIALWRTVALKRLQSVKKK